MAGVLIIGIGLWTQYVTGAIFILATAILAWHSGFRPALVVTAISTAAICSANHGARRQRRLINMPVRMVSMAVISAWSCRGCAATSIDRASGC